MSRLLVVLALVVLGCADAGDESIDGDVAGVLAPPVADWLPAEHAAAAAQARWGLPIPCAGLRVVELPRAELQPVCNSADELAERSANVQTDGCVRPGRCEISIAAGLSAERRELVLTHELGHLYQGRAFQHVAGDECPTDAPGAALMCERGPASSSPWPTPADFDMVLSHD